MTDSSTQVPGNVVARQFSRVAENIISCNTAINTLFNGGAGYLGYADSTTAFRKEPLSIQFKNGSTYCISVQHIADDVNPDANDPPTHPALQPIERAALQREGNAIKEIWTAINGLPGDKVECSYGVSNGFLELHTDLATLARALNTIAEERGLLAAPGESTAKLAANPTTAR